MEPGSWFGPFESDFGLHLVRVLARSEPRQPTFAEAREQAQQVFAAERRAAANAAAFERIRAHYDVVVDWPQLPEEAGAQ
jgi:parvulin-like peptidyl-prolyl isomerase